MRIADCAFFHHESPHRLGQLPRKIPEEASLGLKASE